MKNKYRLKMENSSRESRNKTLSSNLYTHVSALLKHSMQSPLENSVFCAYKEQEPTEFKHIKYSATNFLACMHTFVGIISN